MGQIWNVNDLIPLYVIERESVPFPGISQVHGKLIETLRGGEGYQENFGSS